MKTVALVADALRDCSKRGEIVLDPFGGSGTTMIAAERCGRAARSIEIDPIYCDVIIRRWQTLAEDRRPIRIHKSPAEVEARLAGPMASG